MQQSSDISYEKILEKVVGLKRSLNDQSREVTWLANTQVLGVSRNQLGQIEIFLAGEMLHASTQIVRENLEHENWYRNDSDQFEANRLLFPAPLHFNSVAAFVCVELLRADVITNVDRAFKKTEPLIALTLERLLIADSFLMGLCGELLLLKEMLQISRIEDRKQIVESWFGFTQSSRDFQISTLGVEIKTTSGSSSSHHVSGVHQCEVGHGVNGQIEDDLILVSIGVNESEEDSDYTFTLPQLVDDIADMIRASDHSNPANAVAEFLSKVAAYGVDGELGYEHETMRSRERFQRKYSLKFCRGYDLTDPGVQILSTDDVRSRPNVELDSLRFRINLPVTVTGDLNPAVGISNTVLDILKRSHLL